MAGLFDDLPKGEQDGGLFADLPQEQPSEPEGAMAGVPVFNEAKPWRKGNLLPVSADPAGGVHFDPDAGLLGALKSAFDMSSDIYQGNRTIDSRSDADIKAVLGQALNFSPGTPSLKIPVAASRAATAADVAPPTAQQLIEAGGAGFNALRDRGVHYDQNAINGLSDTIQQGLVGKGYLDVPDAAPGVHAIVRSMQSPAAVDDGVVTFPIDSVIALRHSLGEAAKNGSNATNQGAAKFARSQLDDWIAGQSVQDAVRGTASAQDVPAAFVEANGNYAAGMRAQDLDTLKRTADLRAAAANSGRNFDNTLKGRTASFLTNQDSVRGFSPDEISALESVVQGTRGQRAVGRASRLLGGGGGLGAMLTGGAGAGLGGYIGGPTGAAAVGAALPVIGAGLRDMSGRMTEKAFDAAAAGVRERSPLFEQMVQDAGPVVVGQSAQRAGALSPLIQLYFGRQQ